jgi:phenylalanyl-tRNA synthetase beta chain
MNISTTWLREWINPTVSDEVLAAQLTMAGLEGDGIAPVAPYFEINIKSNNVFRKNKKRSKV